jgi:hypothetical protein
LVLDHVSNHKVFGIGNRKNHNYQRSFVKVCGDGNLLSFFEHELRKTSNYTSVYIDKDRGDQFASTKEIYISSAARREDGQMIGHMSPNLMKMEVIRMLADRGFRIMANSMVFDRGDHRDHESGTERLMMYKEFQQQTETKVEHTN